jgi:hypothetical protein
MDNSIISSGSENFDLVALRTEVAETVVRQYGAEKRYAQALNVTLGSDANGRMWFEVEAKEVGDFAKVVHAEKGELFKPLKAAGHSNPSTIWARVRKIGRAEYFKAQGLNEDGSDPDAIVEGEGEGEGAGSRNRSINLRFVEDLGKLYKAGKREESLSDPMQKALIYVSSALQALGVDLTMLESGK